MPRDDDPRLMTNIDTHAYIEAAKAWGATTAHWGVSDSRDALGCWMACLDALRVYEFERSKQQTKPKPIPFPWSNDDGNQPAQGGALS